ncbi:hypothetical protein RFI_05806 [Reticulomyxa filosa]|uniref:Uncharacterized protein n=1 Tax=Reticulomyxa filosa TaxID=46433 RepID=X6NZK5_RETFI|nr:hypothetical protein RFI_05806 [Reticulomyxa filosa]|eukprot:ETO31318.1 hypothetical protein RFI_05806 [Reticulomyxa filosa]
MHKLKDENELFKFSYIIALGLLSTKLSEKQVALTFQCLVDGLQNKNGYTCDMPRHLLGKISMKLNEIQVDTLFTCLLNEFKHKIKILAYYIQLNDILQYLIDGLRDEDKHVRGSCTQALGAISIRLNENQLKKVFKSLMVTSNDEYEDKIRVQALKSISGKLNKIQLFMLMIDLLQSVKREPPWYVCETLSTMSEEAWKQVAVGVLQQYMQLKSIKENETNEAKQKGSVWEWLFGDYSEAISEKDTIEIELLSFGLLLFSPCIQLNCKDDNIVLDGLNELIQHYNKKATDWGFPIRQQTWNNNDLISHPHLNNDVVLQIQPSNENRNAHKGHCVVIHEAIRSGNLPQLRFVLQNHPDININAPCNEHRQTPLHLAMNNKYWNIARYCIEKGAWIDVRGCSINDTILRTPFEDIMELVMKHKNSKKKVMIKNKKECLQMMEMCKWILRKRTIYPIKQIGYAIDYVKDKVIDRAGTVKSDNKESYETLLQEGATFLLGVDQRELQKALVENNFLFGTVDQDIKAIESENSNQRKSNEWHPLPFLIKRIFLLFKICVRLKPKGTSSTRPRGTIFGQAYEKGIKELQVQLTTYWDYITTEVFKHKCPELVDDWSCNVVDRLMNLRPMPLSSCCEMSLVVGHEGHCIYLSLCKTSTSILVRVDNRLVKTIPSNTPYPNKIILASDKQSKFIQPYLVAYFPWNGPNINQNKKWLKEYVKITTILRDSNYNESMRYLYCSTNNKLFNNSPREGNVLSIVNEWPYRLIQTDTNNGYLQNHNIGYRIRLDAVHYQWFRDQEYNSFVLKKKRIQKNNETTILEIQTK